MASEPISYFINPDALRVSYADKYGHYAASTLGKKATELRRLIKATPTLIAHYEARCLVEARHDYPDAGALCPHARLEQVRRDAVFLPYELDYVVKLAKAKKTAASATPGLPSAAAVITSAAASAAGAQIVRARIVRTTPAAPVSLATAIASQAAALAAVPAPVVVDEDPTE
jgi:hypothetical protein